MQQKQQPTRLQARVKLLILNYRLLADSRDKGVKDTWRKQYQREQDAKRNGEVFY